MNLIQTNQWEIPCVFFFFFVDVTNKLRLRRSSINVSECSPGGN